MVCELCIHCVCMHFTYSCLRASRAMPACVCACICICGWVRVYSSIACVHGCMHMWMGEGLPTDCVCMHMWLGGGLLNDVCACICDWVEVYSTTRVCMHVVG